MTAEPDGSRNRTFALIPGAGGAATWYWQRVAPLLAAAGHEAISVDLPARHASDGLAGYARAVTDAIAGRDDAVLVAASLGGFTAPLVAARVPLAALVFVERDDPGARRDGRCMVGQHGPAAGQDGRGRARRLSGRVRRGHVFLS